MYTWNRLRMTLAAAALLVPATALASHQSRQAEIGSAALLADFESRARELRLLTDAFAIRATHPYHLSWRTHALKLDEIRSTLTTMSTMWSQLASRPDMAAVPELGQWRDRLAAVAGRTNDAIVMLHQNRLAYMGGTYHAAIRDVSRLSRQLSRDVRGSVELARMRHINKTVEAHLLIAPPAE